MNRPSAINKAMPFVNASMYPRDHLTLMSQDEVSRLIQRANATLYPVIRSCTLAILTDGLAIEANTSLVAQYPDFDIVLERHPIGLKVILRGAPTQAFVDGILIKTIHSQIF